MARVSLLCPLLVLVLLAGLASGCGSVDIPPSTEIEPPGRATTNDADASVCVATFDVAPELLVAADSGAARWSTASGCDIHVDGGGIPVRAQDYVFNEEGKRACGIATWNDERTAVLDIAVAVVDAACLPPYTVLHEMGHALAGIQGHTLSGVMADAGSKSKSTRIDSASLQLACVGLRCSRFEPESP